MNIFSTKHSLGLYAGIGERGKLECPEKNLSQQDKNQQQTQPAYEVESGN